MTAFQKMICDHFFIMWYSICILFQSTYTVKITGLKILGFCSLYEQLNRAKYGFIYLFFMTNKFTFLIEVSSI